MSSDYIFKGLFREDIITSALDTDAYKIHMQQVVFEKYAQKEVEYEFRCRSGEDLTDLKSRIENEINRLEYLTFTDDQIRYLSQRPFLKPAFLAALRDYRFHPKRYVRVSIENNELAIRIKGPWFKTILFEIPILAIVSEVRNRERFSGIEEEQFRKVLFQKTQWLKQELKKRGLEKHFKLADFGTRRRYSYITQRDMVDYLRKELPDNFIGTSNYHLAHEFGITAMGTMAHEYLQAHQAFANPRHSQSAALEAWNEVYRGRLGIALTDCISTDSFLESFDYLQAKLFDGVRHDSGCPFEWGEKIIKHYERLGIDPKSKKLVFSDSLNFEKALAILEHFKDRTQVLFGIGTFLSNDMGDYTNEAGDNYKPLNIVIKMTYCDGQPVAKISDEPKKAICKDPIYMAWLKKAHNIPLSEEEQKVIEQPV